jgi:hypothetical protein
MNVEIKTVKLSQIQLNKDNPRRISNIDMDRLVKSLQDFPEMMKLREIVVDETMTVLGGNMRLLALRKIGAKDATAKIVKSLTAEQKREFVIKDNASFGENDWDALANGWSDLPLAEWGVDLPEDWLAGDTGPGEPEPPRANLADRFGVPPFSVLNAREGWWQDRKAAWIALGIKSELGRGAPCMDDGAWQGEHAYNSRANIGLSKGVTRERERERTASFKNQDKLNAFRRDHPHARPVTTPKSSGATEEGDR